MQQPLNPGYGQMQPMQPMYGGVPVAGDQMAQGAMMAGMMGAGQNTMMGAGVAGGMATQMQNVAPEMYHGLQGQSAEQQQYAANQQGPNQQQMQMMPQQGGMPPQVGGSALPMFFNPLASFNVEQEVEILEAFMNIETLNKYKITRGREKLLFAMEQPTAAFMCCGQMGPLRPFTMIIASTSGQEVLKLKRPLKGTITPCGCVVTPLPCLCCAPCTQDFLQVMEVYDCTVPVTQEEVLLGTVRQVYQCPVITNTRKFVVQDNAGADTLFIQAPLFHPWTFAITLPDGQEVGSITKKWSGFMKEMVTDADNFQVELSPNMPPVHKALATAATFLIDFNFFEKGPTQNNRN